MKSKIVSIVVVMLIVVTSCKKHDKQVTNIGALPQIGVAYPIIDSITVYKSYPGYISAVNKAEIVARVSGYINEILYLPGQKVHKGQVLFVIEPINYKDALQQAQASLETAKAQYDYAKSNYNSMLNASQSDAVSQIDVMQAQSAMLEAKSAIKNAEAALSIAKTNLDYCYVKAPFTGHISTATYDKGNYVSLTSQPLATMYNDATVNAYFNIEDNQYVQMLRSRINSSKINFNKVKIEFNNELPHSYIGEINYVSPNVDLSTGTLTLRAKINNKYEELKDGMYASISMPYEHLDNAVMVLDAAISTDQAGKYLYVVNDSNRIVHTPITVGQLINDTLRLVTSGMLYNQRYVTTALLKVRSGMQVSPIVENKIFNK